MKGAAVRLSVCSEVDWIGLIFCKEGDECISYDIVSNCHKTPCNTVTYGNMVSVSAFRFPLLFYTLFKRFIATTSETRRKRGMHFMMDYVLRVKFRGKWGKYNS